MSRVLVIPDVHLKPVMFDRAEEILDSGQAVFAIQLGDLVDDFDEEFNISLYERTMKRAIAFHKKYPQTLWCMGNHDFGYYMPEFGKRETGHSKFQEGIMGTYIREMEKVGLNQKIMHVVGNVIFSHAGITEDFVRPRIPENSNWDGDLEFVMNLLDSCTGDELWEQNSPIWARPQDTGDMMFSDLLQVVGHTPVRRIKCVDNILSTDVFSTYHNGAPYGEQRFAIVDTEKSTWEYAKED